MNLLDNHFAILKASIEDSPSDLKKRLTKIEFEKERANLAYAELINPSKRINFEISWLIDTKISEQEIIQQLADNKINNYSKLLDLSSEPLTITNLLIALFEKQENLDKSQMLDWLIQICKNSEKISTTNVFNLINKHRINNGFAVIADISLIITALKKQLNYYKKSIYKVLNQFPDEIYIELITELSSKLTYGGQKKLAAVAEDLVQDYEDKMKGFLEDEEEKISQAIEELNLSLDNNSDKSLVKEKIAKTLNLIRDWDKISQPLQLAKKGQGVKDTNLEKVLAMIFSPKLRKSFINNEKIYLLGFYLDELEKSFIEMDSLNKNIKNHKEIIEKIMEENKKFELLKDIKQTVDDIADKLLFSKKTELIALINKAATLDNSREMAIPVVNAIRSQRLLKECAKENRLDILEEINLCLSTHFAHIPAVKTILDSEKENINKLVAKNQIQNKPQKSKSWITIILFLFILGGGFYYFTSNKQEEPKPKLEIAEDKTETPKKDETKVAEKLNSNPVEEVKNKIANIVKEAEPPKPMALELPKIEKTELVVANNNLVEQSDNYLKTEVNVLQTKDNVSIRSCPQLTCDSLGIIPVDSIVIPLSNTGDVIEENSFINVEYTGKFCNNPKDKNCSSRSNYKTVQGWILTRNLRD